MSGLIAPGEFALLALWTYFVYAIAARTERIRFGAAVRPKRLTIGAAAIAISAAVAAGETGALAGASFVIGAIAAGEVDARRGLLLDAVTLPLALIAIANAARPEMTASAFAGAVAIGGSFALVFLASRGRAIGLGDVKLLFAFGTLFGPITSLLGIGAACVSGLVAATATALRSDRRSQRRLAFGPHLAFGSAVSFAAESSFVRGCLHL